MTPESAIEIEVWLFQQGDWVSTDFICQRFDISERRLRRLGSGFLVSRTTGGYIHRYHATQAEIKAWGQPLRAHAVSEWKKVRLIERLWRERRRPYPADPSTGQPSLL